MSQHEDAPVTQDQAEQAVRTLLRWAGDDPAREGLLDTPKRVVKAYRDWFSGYGIDPAEYLHRTFEEVAGYDAMVVLPEHDAVVAFFSSTVEMQDVMDLLWRVLLPAMHDGPVDGDDDALTARLASLALRTASQRTGGTPVRPVSSRFVPAPPGISPSSMVSTVCNCLMARRMRCPVRSWKEQAWKMSFTRCVRAAMDAASCAPPSSQDWIASAASRMVSAADSVACTTASSSSPELRAPEAGMAISRAIWAWTSAMRPVIASSVMPMSWTEAETSALNSAMRRSMKLRRAAKWGARAWSKLSAGKAVAISKGRGLPSHRRGKAQETPTTMKLRLPPIGVAVARGSAYTPASRVVARWTCPAGNTRPRHMVWWSRRDDPDRRAKCPR